MTQHEAPSLAAVMFPNLRRDDNAKPKPVLQQERRAEARRVEGRESLLRNLRQANANPSTRR